MFTICRMFFARLYLSMVTVNVSNSHFETSSQADE